MASAGSRLLERPILPHTDTHRNGRNSTNPLTPTSYDRTLLAMISYVKSDRLRWDIGGHDAVINSIRCQDQRLGIRFRRTARPKVQPFRAVKNRSDEYEYHRSSGHNVCYRVIPLIQHQERIAHQRNNRE